MTNNFEDIIKSESSKEDRAKLISEKIRASKGYSWVGIYDVMKEQIEIISCAGRSEPAFSFFPKNKGLNGRAVSQGKTIIVNDTSNDEDYLLTFTNTKSEIIVTVFDKPGKQIIGTIDVEDEIKDAFNNGDVEFLEDCAKKISELWS